MEKGAAKGQRTYWQEFAHDQRCNNMAIVWAGEIRPREPICSRLFACDMVSSSAEWSIIEAPHGDDVPCPRIAPAATTVGSSIWIFGGRTGVDMGEGSLKDLWVFQMGMFGGSGCWDKVEVEGETPQARSYHRMTAHGDKVYVFGGCGQGGRLNDLWELDTSQAPPRWRQLPSSKDVQGRGGAGFCALGGFLYVIGGFCGHELADVHRFDIASETWECVVKQDSTNNGSLPCAGLPPRSVFACAAHGNRILLFGGEVDPSTAGHTGAGEFTNDTYVFDPENRSWQRVEPQGEAPPPRGWMAATAVPKGMLVHGGVGIDNERLSDMWLLEVRDEVTAN